MTGVSRSVGQVNSPWTAEYLIESLLDRLRTGAEVQDAAGASCIGQQTGEDPRNVITWYRSTEGHAADADHPGPRIVGQAARPQDRPVPVARLQRGIGLCLRPKVTSNTLSPSGGFSTPAPLIMR